MEGCVNVCKSMFWSSHLAGDGVTVMWVTWNQWSGVSACSATCNGENGEFSRQRTRVCPAEVMGCDAEQFEVEYYECEGSTPPGENRTMKGGGRVHTPSNAFRHLPPNSARFLLAGADTSIIFVATNTSIVATKVCLSRQNATKFVEINFCCDKRLSR